MKIFLANQSKQKLGGGFRFLENFRKGVSNLKTLYSIVDNFIDCDIYFISSSSMVAKDEVEMAKGAGKKIVLRVDNIPRNSRNRNTGTSRLKKYAEMADLVIYQSKWAEQYIRPFLGRRGRIILNGVDTDIYNTKGSSFEKDGNPQYLYVRYNRDETKRWEKAWYDFQIIQRNQPDANLWIVGKFSPEQVEYNFDFYNNEKFKFWGVVEDEQKLAKIYRGADKLLCPYFREACSNVVAESLACGLEIKYDMLEGGGIAEQVLYGPKSLNNMVQEYLDYFDLLKLKEEL